MCLERTLYLLLISCAMKLLKSLRILSIYFKIRMYLFDIPRRIITGAGVSPIKFILFIYSFFFLHAQKFIEDVDMIEALTGMYIFINIIGPGTTTRHCLF